MNQQQLNLTRVRERLRGHIMAFAAAHVGRDFFMKELVEYVAHFVETAPDSASRILRDLRAKGRLDYVVISRSRSHYRITRVREQQKVA